MDDRKALRRLGVGALTFLVTAVAAVFAFAIGLVVADFVALPLAVMATAVIAAVVASWAAGRLAGDGTRTDVNKVVTRSVAWALIPAGVALLNSLFPGLPFPVFVVVVIYTAVAATVLAFRHRTSESTATRELGTAAAWLAGTAVFTGAVVFVASLFGLVGT